jgi:hypothetical protein
MVTLSPTAVLYFIAPFLDMQTAEFRTVCPTSLDLPYDLKKRAKELNIPLTSTLVEGLQKKIKEREQAAG